MARPQRYRQQYSARNSMVPVFQTRQPQPIHIQYSTLCQYFPDVLEDYPTLVHHGLDLNMMEIDSMHEGHEFAWYLIFTHASLAFESRRNPNHMTDRLEDWLSGGPFQAQNLVDPQSVPTIIKALGDLLSPECLGCPHQIFTQLSTFLTNNFARLLTQDPYVAVATLSALCDAAELDPVRLQKLVMLVKALPSAEDLIWWAVTDPECIYYFPISDELQTALQLQVPRNCSSWLPPTPPTQWPAQRPFGPRSRQRLALTAPPVFAPSSAQMVAPPIRRPPMHNRTQSTPSIKGNHLSPSVLMNIAYMYPDKVKVDSRVFMNNARNFGWPGIGSQLTIGPRV